MPDAGGEGVGEAVGDADGGPADAQPAASSPAAAAAASRIMSFIFSPGRRGGALRRRSAPTAGPGRERAGYRAQRGQGHCLGRAALRQAAAGALDTAPGRA